MVNKLLCCVLILTSTIADAITPDEIRAIDGEAAREQKARDARVKPGDVDLLLPPPKPTPAAPDDAVVRSSKYSTSATPATAHSVQPDAATPAASPRSLSDSPPGALQPNTSHSAATRVVAPADAIRSDGVAANTKKYFGIPLGTWFQVSLNRNVSNAESGQVELTVVADVPGARRTMPSGTLLFAEKVYNQGTKRLDCRAVRGITPKGYEFRIAALCYDLQKVAGLNGIVNVDEKAVANNGMQRGVLSALRAATTTVAGSNPIAAQGIQGAADSVLNDTGQAAEQAAAPAYTIFVAPQKMLIRIDESL